MARELGSWLCTQSLYDAVRFGAANLIERTTMVTEGALVLASGTRVERWVIDHLVELGAVERPAPCEAYRLKNRNYTAARKGVRRLLQDVALCKQLVERQRTRECLERGT